MKSAIHPRALRKLAVALAAAISLLVLTSAPAWAAPPPNDAIGNATPIMSLPFHDAEDISQATSAPTDVSECFGQTNTVWYQFTPTTSQKVVFDPINSNQTMAIDVFSGSPGALTFVGCGQGAGGDGFNPGFTLNATAGTTYWIMVSPLCCTSTPNLDLWVYAAVAPQASITVTGGTMDHAGNVTITGTLNCTGTAPAPVGISGTVSQPVGRKSSVTGNFSTSVNCGPNQAWSALAQPNTGKFAGGYVTVDVPTVFICNIVGCAAPSDTQVIKISG